MKCSIEIAVKRIILNHYRTFHQPVGKKELNGMVQQKVGGGYSSVEFSSVLKMLKDGDAIIEDPIDCFLPNYDEVEM